MSDSIANSSEQRRPMTSRKNSENVRSQSFKPGTSPSMDKSKRETTSKEALPIDETSTPAPSDPPQETKVKRKPRKLALRNLQASTSLLAPVDDKSTGVETKEISLDSRVSVLEQEYRKLNKRTNSNTSEISKLQAITRLTPEIGVPQQEPSSTKAKVSSQQQEAQQSGPAIQPDHKSKDPLPTELKRVEELSDEEIETIPRSEQPAVGDRADQNRSVALKGSYKIPLPSTLSTDDVRAVQSGFAAASTVAREIATAMRGGGSGSRSVSNDTGLGHGEATPTTSTSIATVDPHIETSPRSWTSLLNSCTKLVSNAANAIEIEAAVEATRNELIESERAYQESRNTKSSQRPTTMHNTRPSTRQKPAAKAQSYNVRSEVPNPATPPPKPSTRRRSSATAPTQSSASKTTTRAAGARLTSQSKPRPSLKAPKNVLSERPRTATALAGKKMEVEGRPKVRTRMNSSSAL